jgi:hypothetical protein
MMTEEEKSFFIFFSNRRTHAHGDAGRNEFLFFFQIGGRTLMMTEEEKSIYELTIGKTGIQVVAR